MHFNDVRMIRHVRQTAGLLQDALANFFTGVFTHPDQLDGNFLGAEVLPSPLRLAHHPTPARAY
jgi:hypothetical protein